MESPIRKMQKKNDYNRHKLLRKIKRRRKAAVEQQSRVAEKELKKKLKMKMPKFEDGKDDYYSYMEKLASKKAREWGYKSVDAALTSMLNDNTYNYEEFYKRKPELAKAMLAADPDAHFSDIGKTVYHPTFSNESVYSGKVSDYNPRGTEGGSWGGNGTYWGDYYAPSVSQIRNGDFNYFNTWKYLKQAEASPTFIKMPSF